MTTYIKLETLEYPFFAEDIVGKEDQYASIVPTEVPEYSLDKIIIEESPELINGEWHQKWTIRDMTAEEIFHRSIYTLMNMSKDRLISKEDLKTNLINLGLSEDEADLKLLSIRN